ncbi:tandem-95 repeat protein [Flammeovirga sp. MY04]|uniref:Ig-like domain-containing protein n=1 Tax=Flammeovirga sp. MY04 TaxID=1191459 RepID=UPI00080638D8|nr:Ig-like domain-containing protein [Flammeovirga sp. MY04]ANQ49353.1 tandem-95 repeat protein [Flammeovirga sp. MY04]
MINRLKELFVVLLIFIPTFSYAQTEICDNGIDDDNDGLVDCFDPDCTNFPGCDGFYFGNDSANCQVIPPIVPNFNIVPKFSTDPNVAKIEQRSGVMVADLDLDSIPELIGKSMPKGEPGYINIFSGADGTLLQQITEKGNTHAYTQVAIADVDKNGLGDIFVNENRTIRRYEYLSDRFIAEATQKVVSNLQTPQIADFDGDGIPEVYLGNAIFNAVTLERLVAPDSAKNSGSFSYNMSTDQGNKIEDSYTLAYDVFQPGDSNPNGGTFGNEVDGLELIAGGKVYAVDLTGGTLTELVSCPLPSGYSNYFRPGDGFVSIGDFTGNNKLEVIVAAKINKNDISIYLWSPYTQTYLGNYVFENSDKIGRCNLGDFDNDGMIEVGTAGKNQYVVLEYNASSNSLVEKWKRTKLDDGSQMTGSTLFDFDGDGNIEVVYSEEENLFIWRWDEDSQTFIEVSKVISRAGTRTEYPLVADVNADGQAEIVMAAQDVNGPDADALGFIQVWGSYDSPWVSCRNLWNQHGYHVTNINDDLTIPVSPQDNFNPYFEGTLNSFLSQTPFITDSLNISFATPDLIIPDIEADLSDCADGSDIPINITIENQGDWSAALGTPVTLYNGDPYSSSTAVVIDTVHLTQTIQPGESTIVNALVPQDGTNTIELYILANHNPYAFDGSFVSVPLPADTVYTPLLECDYSNNLSLKLEINGCVIPPTVDLDNNNSSGIAGADYQTVYYKGSETSGELGDEDTKITLLGTNFISNAVINLTTIESTDSLTVRGSLPGSLTWSYTSGTNQITLDGGGTKAEFEEALQMVHFTNAALTNFNQRSITTVLNITTTNVSSNVANTYIDIKSRPTSQDETRTIDEDTFYDFSAADFTFNDEDGDTFDGIRVSFPLDPLNFRGHLVYDGDTITIYQLTIGYEIPNPALLRYYPIEDQSNDNHNPYCIFNFRVKDNTGVDLTHHHSIRHTFTINVNPIADPPISRDTTVVVREVTPETGLITQYFEFSTVDVGATFSKVKIVSLPDKGTLTYNGSGTYVPVTVGQELDATGGFNVQYTSDVFVPGVDDIIHYSEFDFKVIDSNTTESDSTYHVYINLLKDIVILDFWKYGLKNQNIYFEPNDFLTHYHSETNQPLSKIVIKSLPGNGVLTYNGDTLSIGDEIDIAGFDDDDATTPNFIFDPDQYFSGLTSFLYNVIDQPGDVSTQDATINIFIRDVRHEPVAVDDFTGTVANVSVIIDALANDYDDDNDSIFITRITNVEHGTASIVEQRVYFVPEYGYVGSDANAATIDYVISDGREGTSTATIHINITNDAPEVGNLYYGGYVGDTIHFSAHDFESRFRDSQTLQKIKFTSLPSQGTIYTQPQTAIAVNQEINTADIDQLYYINNLPEQEITENFNWNGSDGTQFADADGNVRIHLYQKTHPPTAVNDIATTVENASILIDVLANDSDQDGDSIYVTIVDMEEIHTADGTVVIENNQVRFTPTIGFTGLTYARYFITDDRDGSSEAIIRITVVTSPDAPLPLPFEKYGEKNQDLPLSLLDFEDHYTDPNNMALDSVRLENDPSDGTLFLNNTQITVLQGISRNDLDDIVYRPNTDYLGDDQVRYNVYNGEFWGRASSSITFHIVEELDNITPVVVDITKKGSENEDIPITLSDFENAFTDPRDSAMMAIRILSLPEHGDITFDDQEVMINQIISADSLDQLIYSPDNGFAGNDSLHWNATNGMRYADEDAAVLIQIGPELVIYSSFTPNNDGINDYWHIKDIEFYPNNEVTIYNRWGNAIYNASGYDNTSVRWEGTNNQSGVGSNILPASTYFYKVDLKDGSPVRSGYVVLAK